MKPKLRFRGPLAAALTKVYPNQQPTIIVRSLASGFLKETGLKCAGPPFDPFLCAKASGLQIEYGGIQAEAVFFDDKKNQPKIIVKSRPATVTESYWRRLNFTLAHELGHFVIRSTLAGFFPASRFKDHDSEEEFLCNLFAEELLMPSGVIAQDLRNTGLDPGSLIELTHKYRVSLRCLLCRITRFGRGNVVSAIWTNTNGGYSASWASPNPYRRMILCDTGKTTVERAFSSNETQSGRDDLMLDGKRMKWLSVSKLLGGSTEVLTVMRRKSDLPYSFLPVTRLDSNQIQLREIKSSIATQPLLPFGN
jgi:IrrE N-terminal-like domain